MTVVTVAEAVRSPAAVAVIVVVPGALVVVKLAAVKALPLAIMTEL